MSFRKQFRAPPLKDRNGKVIPFRKTSRTRRRATETRNWAAIIVLAIAVGLIGAGLYVRFFENAELEPVRAESGLPPASAEDTLSYAFARCAGRMRHTCVVDGDTFWLEGEKYRISDINTPEISSPGCDRELALGQRATDRLVDLLNAGSFSLRQDGDNTDRYGRKLRTIHRGGVSLGDVMVEEGLAERWRGFRGEWC